MPWERALTSCCFTLVAWLVLPDTAFTQQAEASAKDTMPAAPSSPCDSTSIPGAHPSTAEALRQWEDYDFARTYAPILRFASPERLFPTVPFFTAFDLRTPEVLKMSDTLGYMLMRSRHQGWAGMDTLARRVDTLAFESLHGTEVTTSGPVHLRKPWLPSFSYLKRRYQITTAKAAYAKRVPEPAVFYRVCDLRSNSRRGRYSDVRKLWRYLRSDEQAWQRFGMDTIGVPDTTSFRVIEYLFYYVADAGLQGHSDDLESVFIFVPRDTLKAKRFRIVVGAGHKDPAPNNVLVMFPTDSGMLDDKYNHAQVLVEYGGHSSAPDMPPFGQFSIGLDVNWHIDDVWGTRDPQASAGIAFHGRYDATMTYPRDPDDAITYFPRYIGRSTLPLLQTLVRLSPVFLAERVKAELEGDSVTVRLVQLAEVLVRAYEDVSVQQQRRTHRTLRSFIQGLYAVDSSRNTGSAAASRQQDSTARLTADRILSGLSPADSAASSRTIREHLDSARVTPRHGTTSTLADSVAALLRETSDSLAQARVMILLARHLQPPTSLETTANLLQAITNERLQPTYALIPGDYLQALYHGIAQNRSGEDSTVAREQAERYLALITALLEPQSCRPISEDFACGLYDLDGAKLDSALQSSCQAFPNSLACRMRQSDSSLHRMNSDSLLTLMSFWNGDLWDAHFKHPFASHQMAGDKHKLWQHSLYRDPVGIFRTHLFRPTWVQSKRSTRDAVHLLAIGLSTFFGDDALLPYVGIMIPAFQNIPVHIPGFLEVQLGPMWGSSERATSKPMGSIGVLYDSQFAYFLGWFAKGLWVNRRSEVEGRPGAPNLSATAGVSLWCPCIAPLHLRTGLRTDMEKLRPSFDHVGWELQLEARF